MKELVFQTVHGSNLYLTNNGYESNNIDDIKLALKEDAFDANNSKFIRDNAMNLLSLIATIDAINAEKDKWYLD